MTIVVDGYNFIKHVIGASFLSDREIKHWLDTFHRYMTLRHNKVIVVFDAGPGYYKTTELHGDVTVLYSGQQQSADDLIKDWLQKHQGKDILLVTSDRDICDFASRLNLVSVGSDDFYRVFKSVMEQEDEYEQEISGMVHKISEDSTPELDELMEIGSRALVADDVHRDDSVPIRVRSGKKASKQSKKLMKKIEKI